MSDSRWNTLARPIAQKTRLAAAGSRAGLGLDALGCALVLLGWALPPFAGRAQAPPNVQPVVASTDPVQSDLLQLLDGSSLHGRLQGIDIEQGLRWQHPAAKAVIRLKPASVASIQFDNVKRIAADSKPKCWFQFRNGDELFGNLRALDSETVQFDTWFGGQLSAPREALRSVTFFAKGFSILYEGPTSPEGWKMERSPKAWQYRDGAFVANGVGILGRDMKLNGSSSFEFDLGWSGHFSLSFIMYTEAFDRFDYSTSCYMFHLAPGYINLQRVQSGAGVTSLGQAQIASMVGKSKARFEIRINKEEAAISVFVDGVLAQRWQDHGGFVARGSGVVFSSQMDNTTIRLSNMRLAEWDGTFEPRSAPSAETKEDVIHLINRDKVAGQLAGIQDGKLVMAIPQTKLVIPMERVTQLVLKESGTNAPSSKPWEIRVDVAGGGTVAFQLAKWEPGHVAGTSPIFGPLHVDPQSIRQVQFNLERSRPKQTLAKPSGEQTLDFDE